MRPGAVGERGSTAMATSGSDRPALSSSCFYEIGASSAMTAIMAPLIDVQR
jgi:hypothetical protein